ncbi:F0F1 ATP synthase subunit A [Paenibacillus arenilitoris]|uniref:ATP synthase subunit a n=1 Tax=Paenibacillus arenilitoris TaxID=2772299 RepID=A0A927H697_9BACL|nr:F0F1 ATP synthase subunit A [Paenibacillus arenilitoris]MBD2868339.1 F0F1 ATP synthase subunit A [Paenibacillus arenilitoris]
MHEFPIWQLGPLDIEIASFIAITISALVTFLVARLAVANLSVDNPSKMQNFLEWVVDFVHNLISSAMPLKRVKPFLSLGMTLIMFIFISNLLGLPFGIVTVPHHEMLWLGITEEMVKEHVEIAWWKSPTADISVTAGLALIVFVIVHYLGLKLNNKHYLKHYFHPYPIFFPVNIIETISKPVTLALRLFANIYAGEVLIATILMLKWVGIPFLIAWQGFSIFVGGIQAFLFTMLTMVYISQAAIHDEDDHH